MRAWLLFLFSLTITASQASADCIDTLNNAIEQRNAVVAQIKRMPELDMDKMSAQVYKIEIRKQIDVWQRAYDASIRQLNAASGCAAAARHDPSFVGTSRKKVEQARTALEAAKRIQARLDAPSNTPSEPAATRPSNKNSGSSANGCLQERTKKNGRYVDYVVQNSCDRSVTYDYDDCDQDSNLQMVCKTKTTSIGRRRTSGLSSNFRNPPNIRNFR